MKKNLITGLVLAIFALICGLLLSVVNIITSPRIEKQEKEKIEEALKSVLEYDSDIFELISPKDKDEIDHSDISGVDAVYYIRDKETKEIGACVYQISKKGFASTITMMISVNKNHEIIDSTVVSSAETKGNIKTWDFNMKGKSELDDFESLSGSNFNKLAGSSVSSKAVYKCFNLALYLSYIDMEGGN